MKFAAFFLILFIAACNNRQDDEQVLQARLDSLQQHIKTSYVPGFGELMLNIQIHHAKLWFAGRKGNWELASYNESLIRSAFSKIRTWHPENPAAAATEMIRNPMDSIDAAIVRKDLASFKRGFVFLTTTCNNCHAVTKHPFNVITIPRSEPIGNQSFDSTGFGQ